MPTQPIRSPRLFKLFSKGKMLNFTKGESMYTTDEKDDIVLVLRGYIKRYLITNAGSLRVQIVYGPKDIFSLTKIYDVLLGQSLYSGPEVYFYEAMCNVRTLFLSSALLAETVKTDPLLYKELFAEAGQHLKACVHNIENVSFNNAYVRVAHKLLFFAREFGEVAPTGVRINVPITQQDLADMLNLSRETVSLETNNLRRKGLISGKRDKTIISDLEKLENEIYKS